MHAAATSAESGGAADAVLRSAAHGHSVKRRTNWRGLGQVRALRVIAASVVMGTLAACGSSSTGPSGRIATIVISPDSISLATGNSGDLSALARSQSGTSVSAGAFFWSTSDSLVATVSQSGVVAAHEAGVAQIDASADGVSGFARVVVVDPLVKTVVITPASDTIYASHPGDTAKLSAAGYDAAGHVLPGSTLLWSVNNALATVSNGTVVGTNTSAGTVTVTAASPDSGNPAGTASMLVIGHVANVVLSAPYTLLSASSTSLDTVRVTATLTDTFGNNVSGQRTLSWSSNNSSVATVDSRGLVTALSTTAPKEVQITATTPDGASAPIALLVFP